jgi:hypothetical protein
LPSFLYTARGKEAIVSDNIRTQPYTAEKVNATSSSTDTPLRDVPPVKYSRMFAELSGMDGFSTLRFSACPLLPNSILKYIPSN